MAKLSAGSSPRRSAETCEICDGQEKVGELRGRANRIAVHLAVTREALERAIKALGIVMDPMEGREPALDTLAGGLEACEGLAEIVRRQAELMGAAI